MPVTLEITATIELLLIDPVELAVEQGGATVGGQLGLGTVVDPHDTRAARFGPSLDLVDLMKGLENGRDFPAQPLGPPHQIVGRRTPEATARRQERNRLEDIRLARPVRPEQGENLALADVEIDIVERAGAVLVGLGQAADRQDGFVHARWLREQQRGVTIGIEAVLAGYSVFIGLLHGLKPGKRADQHEQGRPG